ncbi:uncharacterized protein [Penaeus vannamei]|uniref:uncharacterized protein n=1 Tax=Penaeus vannamei TaxID=6689 RepID=UPI00387F6DDE
MLTTHACSTLPTKSLKMIPQATLANRLTYLAKSSRTFVSTSHEITLRPYTTDTLSLLLTPEDDVPPPHRMLHLTVNLRHTATLTHDDLRDHGAPTTICRSILGACHQMRHQCIGRCRRLEGDPFAWPSGMSADGLGFTPRHCSCLTSWLRTFLTSPRLSLPALRHARKNGHPKNRVRGTSASRTKRRWI